MNYANFEIGSKVIDSITGGEGIIVKKYTLVAIVKLEDGMVLRNYDDIVHKTDLTINAFEESSVRNEEPVESQIGTYEDTVFESEEDVEIIGWLEETTIKKFHETKPIFVPEGSVLSPLYKRKG